MKKASKEQLAKYVELRGQAKVAADRFQLYLDELMLECGGCGPMQPDIITGEWLVVGANGQGSKLSDLENAANKPKPSFSPPPEIFRGLRPSKNGKPKAAR